MISFADLSSESRDLLMAFVAMARDEAAGSDWEDVAPTLRSYWEREQVLTPQWRRK